jgi:hypothetical protein
MPHGELRRRERWDRPSRGCAVPRRRVPRRGRAGIDLEPEVVVAEGHARLEGPVGGLVLSLDDPDAHGGTWSRGGPPPFQVSHHASSFAWTAVEAMKELYLAQGREEALARGFLRAEDRSPWMRALRPKAGPIQGSSCTVPSRTARSQEACSSAARGRHAPGVHDEAPGVESSRAAPGIPFGGLKCI